MSAPTFSRGGGGVSFEQLVGALQLTSVLTGGNSLLLGDDVTVTAVKFQATTVAVDDLVVTGLDGAGRERRAVVGIRHNPTIAAGDEKFVALVGDFLRVFAAHRSDFDDGSWTLSLVVADPHTGAAELATLTDLARDATTVGEFTTLVAARNKRVRNRHGYFVSAIAKAIATDTTGALKHTLVGADGSPRRDEFIRSLLRCLRVARLDVEGDAARDRTVAIDQLAQLTEGDNATAAALWAELVNIVVADNPTGATLAEPSLRTRIATPAGPGRRYARLRGIVSALEASLRTRVRSTLTSHSTAPDAGGTQLHLPRQEEVDRLLDEINAEPASHILVTGASGVGKSALALAAIDELRARGAHTVLVHADDIAALGTASDPFEGQLGNVLATATTEARRFLLLDGAESGVLDARIALLMAAARAGGHRCVVVCRDDVADDIAAQMSGDTTGSGAGGGGGATRVTTHLVTLLTDGEVEQIVEVFPSLATIASRPRAADLLSRPGLVDAILRSGPENALAAASPQAPVSELEVFGRYWERVVAVRRPGASAAGRADAAIAAARQTLRPDLPHSRTDGQAVDSLRSDGILATLSPFAPGTRFATDLDLDFATVSLLLAEGLHLVQDAQQPRYALRATRLAVQARLAEQGHQSMSAIREELAHVADAHGQRWTELADEALLGHPQSPGLLGHAWPELAASPDLLLALLNTARRLHYPTGSAHTVSRHTSRPNPATEALRPLVEVLVAHDTDIAAFGSDTFRAYQDLLLAYLRGLHMHRWPADDLPTAASIQVAFANRRDSYSQRPACEAVALLFRLDQTWATAHLRDRVHPHAGQVVEALESPYSILELLRGDPSLLAELAMGYYIDPDDRGYGAGEGIRDHSFTLGGIAASPHRGPFHGLLRVAPEHGVPLIRAVLHRAAVVRQAQMARHASRWATTPETRTREPVTLNVPGLVGRTLAGDAQSWHWHRGTGVGPAPALSAAMAYERWLERRIEAGEDIAAVAGEVLAEATTLTEAGIVHTLLLRHRPISDPALAEWFRERLVSELEIGRVQHEYRRDDPADDSWRNLAPNAVATEIAVHALMTNDPELLAALPRIADDLVAAQTDPEDGVRPEVLLTAALLRPATYRRVDHDDVTAFIPIIPTEVTEGLSSGTRELDLFMRSLRLSEAYSPADRPRFRLRDWMPRVQAADVDGPSARLMRESPDEFAAQFKDDLRTAKTLAENPLPAEVSVLGAGPVCAVAAFVLTVAEDALVTPEDRAWALMQLLAHADDASPYEDRSTQDQRAPSRAAARALPTRLTASDTSPEDREATAAALLGLATHQALEVRRVLTRALRPIWLTGCAGDDGPCHHVTGRAVIDHLFADARRPISRREELPAVPSAAELTTFDPTGLELGVVTVAAAAAIDATAISAQICHQVTMADTIELEQALVATVCAITRTGSRDGEGYHLMAEAALRRDQAAAPTDAPLGTVSQVAHQFLATSTFDWWRTALFDVAEDHRELRRLLADLWVPLAREMFAVLKEKPGPLTNDHRVQLAALIPPSDLDGEIDPDLDGLLAEWLPLAADNGFAFDTYAKWAQLNDSSGHQVLDALDALIPVGDPVPPDIHGAHDLFAHLMSKSLSPAAEARAFKRIDQFVAAGHDSLRSLTPHQE